MALAYTRGGSEGGDDRLRPLADLRRVDAQVERRDVQAEHLDAGAEVCERAVGHP